MANAMRAATNAKQVWQLAACLIVENKKSSEQLDPVAASGAPDGTVGEHCTLNHSETELYLQT